MSRDCLQAMPWRENENKRSAVNVFERIFVFERGSYAGIMTEQKQKDAKKKQKRQ